MSSHHDAPTSPTNPLATLLLHGLRQSPPNHVIHVGGGDGALLADLLQNLPAATGVLFDERTATSASGTMLDAAGVTERVDVIADGGDDPVPPGGDLYLLTGLPESDLGHTAMLLRRCHAAMTAKARLLVCRPRHPDDRATALTDLLGRAGFGPIAFDATDPAWEVTASSPTPTSTVTDRRTNHKEQKMHTPFRLKPLSTKLGEIPWLRDVPAHERELIDRHTTMIDVPASTILCGEGQPGFEAFIVLSGDAAVIADGQPVAQLTTGDICGEMALIQHSVRSAHVVALTPMLLLAMSTTEFDLLLRDSPTFIHQLLNGMATRLNDANHVPSNRTTLP